MKVVLYCRVSTKDQNIDTQLIPLKEFCQRNNWIIHKEYVDIGESGSKESRPAFDELINDMRQRCFDTILVYKLDRIGRSLQHLINIFQEFKNRSINFVSYSQNIDTTTPEGRMFLQIIMVLAEYERELIVSRTKDGLKRALKQGKKLGRPKGSKDKKKRRKSGYWQRWNKG